MSVLFLPLVIVACKRQQASGFEPQLLGTVHCIHEQRTTQAPLLQVDLRKGRQGLAQVLSDLDRLVLNTKLRRASSRRHNFWLRLVFADDLASNVDPAIKPSSSAMSESSACPSGQDDWDPKRRLWGLHGNVQREPADHRGPVTGPSIDASAA